MLTKLLILAIFAFILLAFVWFGANKAFPVERLITDITSSSMEIQVSWPKAKGGNRLYNFVLGVPRGSSPKFNGRIRVFKEGQDLIDFPFSSLNAKPCNWLQNNEDDPNLDGFILTWETEDLFGHIVQGDEYSINIKFNELPPEGSSLWLCYLASLWNRNM